MKIFFFCLLPFLLVGQSLKKESIILEIGKPFFYDVTGEKKSLTAGISYLNKFSETFAYEAFYHYAQSNNYPSFYNSKMELEEYYLQEFKDGADDINLYYDSLWSSIYAHFLGGRIHYSFVNSEKFFFSFNVGMGLYIGKSSNNIFENLTITQEMDRVISLDVRKEMETITTPFFAPGIQAAYSFTTTYSAGIKIDFYTLYTSNEQLQTPVLGEHYNLALSLGYNF